MREIVLQSGNKIEIHYFLKNNSHSMDAKILHDCNGDILTTIKNISELLGIEYVVETVAVSEGGLKQVLQFTEKHEGKITLLIAIVALIFTIFPPKNNLSDLEKRNLELQNQKLEMEIKQLQQTKEGEVIEEKSIEAINEEHDITVSKSHFYERLSKYEKVEKLEYSILGEDNSILESITIANDDFIDFIREEEKSPETVDDKAEIFLISPILVDRKYKWKGLYHGEEIDFFMNDGRFRDEIVNRDVTFQAGTLLICKLLTRRKIDESGVVKITSHAVESVYEISSASGRLLTILGKRKRKEEKDEQDQGKLDL